MHVVWIAALWVDYPGPVFSSWLQVRSFLHDIIVGRIRFVLFILFIFLSRVFAVLIVGDVIVVAFFSMNEILLLQHELQSWYSVFRRENRRLVWNAVTEAMEDRQNLVEEEEVGCERDVDDY
jgi:hypothetical protein